MQHLHCNGPIQVRKQSHMSNYYMKQLIDCQVCTKTLKYGLYYDYGHRWHATAHVINQLKKNWFTTSGQCMHYPVILHVHGACSTVYRMAMVRSVVKIIMLVGDKHVKTNVPTTHAHAMTSLACIAPLALPWI